MKLVKIGKTKDVYDLEDGSYLLQFKDDVTGSDGVFDPGANTVGLTLSGAGQAGLAMTVRIFNELQKQGVATHFISADLEKATMVVKPATLLGKGIEIICRYRAVGSFFRRYGGYIASGTPIPAFVEVTLKDDERGDPPLTKDCLELLGILTPQEYENIVAQTKSICQIIKDFLALKGMELYDIKLEFGRSGGEIILIDEISLGSMRVYADGEPLAPLELSQRVVS
ncbi:MAG: phosphoribosylaminoimidazolesuccinocarboxamide synthase [Symbiobacteriaceae bacterium]|nr:phosphoribosylaminoimidazolesuccinocarboxamide synthase [Symbiobacteriaceae bacterium]